MPEAQATVQNVAPQSWAIQKGIASRSPGWVLLAKPLRSRFASISLGGSFFLCMQRSLRSIGDVLK